jgi:hypothetical protein
MSDVIWPDQIEAQTYAALLLASLAAVVGLLWTISAERRYWRRKLSRIGERNHTNERRLRTDLYRAEAEVVRLQNEARRSQQQTLVEHWRGTPAAEQTIVAGAAVDPDETTFIDRGEVTT